MIRAIKGKHMRRVPKEMRKQFFSGVQWGRKPCSSCKEKKRRLKDEPVITSIIDVPWKEVV